MNVHDNVCQQISHFVLTTYYMQSQNHHASLVHPCVCCRQGEFPSANKIASKKLVILDSKLSLFPFRRTQEVAALVSVLICGLSRGADMPGDLGSILREIFNNRGGGADNRAGFDNRGGHDSRYHWMPLDQSFFIYMGFIGENGQLYTLAYPPSRNPGFTDGGKFGGNHGDHRNPGVFNKDQAKKRIFGVSRL